MDLGMLIISFYFVLLQVEKTKTKAAFTIVNTSNNGT